MIRPGCAWSPTGLGPATLKAFPAAPLGLDIGSGDGRLGSRS